MIVRAKSATLIDFEGLSILDYTAELDTSLSFATIAVPPGVRHREARSTRSDKYYYVVAGEIQFTLDGHVSPLTAGDFCLVRCGQRFSYANPSANTARIILVHTPSFDLSSEEFLETE